MSGGHNFPSCVTTCEDSGSGTIPELCWPEVAPATAIRGCSGAPLPQGVHPGFSFTPLPSLSLTTAFISDWTGT